MGERLSPSEEIARRFAERKLPKVRLEIQGNRGALDAQPGLVYVVGELVGNCVNQHAGRITVRVGEGSLTVEDDVRHPNTDEILVNLNSRYPITTKQPTHDTELYDSDVIGGIGIQESRRILEEDLDGSLTYHGTEDGRIIATVSWK
jgi:hypothetical protein